MLALKVIVLLSIKFITNSASLCKSPLKFYQLYMDGLFGICPTYYFIFPQSLVLLSKYSVKHKSGKPTVFKRCLLKEKQKTRKKTKTRKKYVWLLQLFVLPNIEVVYGFCLVSSCLPTHCMHSNSSKSICSIQNIA